MARRLSPAAIHLVFLEVINRASKFFLAICLAAIPSHQKLILSFHYFGLFLDLVVPKSFNTNVSSYCDAHRLTKLP